MDVYTLLDLKWINAWKCIAHGTLLNVTWHSGGEGSWGRIDMCICTAESPEAITALLIGYTPIQIKSLKENSSRSLHFINSYAVLK